MFKVRTASMQRALQALGRDVQIAAEKAIRDAASTARKNAKATTLWNDRPDDIRPRNAGPHLRKAIFSEASGLRGKVVAPKKYASFLEYGTRAHGPVKANFLRFKVPGGMVVYTKWVRGITPRPFMREASEVGGFQLHTSMEHYRDRAIEKFNSKK